ncbi:glycosyl hydrolase family 18 protein [Kitasatospora fiedleri]|uniref:glycosyl hydrolase family 18 protein n=1 Tax=Kitasatospora fiedleri TaxID=2991545 RepID=UPI00249B095F|nr:glycosyl hydrolase family 18 protein [Kitasatospora fiedleri]
MPRAAPLPDRSPFLRRRRYRLPLLAVGSLLAPLLTVSRPAGAAHAAEPTAVFHQDQDWGTGHGGGYTVTNAGSAAINGWTLEFDLPANHTLGVLWNATYTAAASHVTVKNQSWQPQIAPGASYDFGFNVAYSGPYAELRNCKLNGRPAVRRRWRRHPAADGPGRRHRDPVRRGPGHGLLDGVHRQRQGRRVRRARGRDAGPVRPRPRPAPAATVSGLAPDTPYTFTVKARDAAGNTSSASHPVTVRTGKVDPRTGLTIGYFTQWSVYARGYSVKKLDTSGSAAQLDYLNYAFATIHPSTKQCFLTNKAAGNDSDPNAGDGAGDAWADFGRGWDATTSVAGTTDTWDQKPAGNFNQLRQLKAKYPNLKVQISLGGWSYGKWFSDAAATDASRKAPVSSCIDLDWEWPNSEGHLGNVVRPADKANYTLLVQEFRRRLDALGASTGTHYTLSAFLPADPAKITAGIDIPGLFGAFDFATVQGYDHHGAWETTTNQQSAPKVAAGDPSAPDRRFSSEIAVSAYLNGGAPKSELTLGVPFYGRGWTGVPRGSTNGLFQPATVLANGLKQQAV